MTASEVSELQQKIRRFLASRGMRGDEDMEQEMLCDWLRQKKERPDQILNMEFVFLHAMDRLHPRTNEPGGGKVYRDAMDHQAREPVVVSEKEMEPLVNRVVSIDAYRKPRVAEVREIGKKMSKVKYLSRLPFGHFPFCL